MLLFHFKRLFCQLQINHIKKKTTHLPWVIVCVSVERTECSAELNGEECLTVELQLTHTHLLPVIQGVQ